MKKTVLAFMIIVLANLAFADTPFTLYKGWNMVPLGISEGGSQCNSDGKNISAVYLYSPLENKYVGFPVTQSGSPPKEYQDKMDAMRRLYEPMKQNYLTPTDTGTSAWVYYPGDTCNTTVRTSNSYSELSTKKLFRGWNFLTVLPWMRDVSLGTMFGNCEVQTIASWSPPSQRWDAVLKGEQLKTVLGVSSPFIDSDSDIGKTFVVKTANECALSATSPLPPAPTLPD